MQSDKRLADLLDSLGRVEPSKPRKREYLYMLIAIALIPFAGRDDYEAAKIIEARKQELRPAASFPLSYPLDCDAKVAQRGAGEHWKERCYFRKVSR